MPRVLGDDTFMQGIILLGFLSFLFGVTLKLLYDGVRILIDTKKAHGLCAVTVFVVCVNAALSLMIGYLIYGVLTYSGK